MKTDTKPLMKHQTFPGASRFWFNGRLVTGPDRRWFFFAILLILIPAVITGGLTWTWLFIFLPLYITLPLLAINCFLVICDFVFMFITAFKDPGIIPRHASPISDSDSPWEAGRKQPDPEKKLYVNGSKVRVKYCVTCHLYRPPRATHCGVCDNCVDRFDHHCPWVGNCIGRRNYQSFFIFVWSVILTSIYQLLICILHILIVSIRASQDIHSNSDRFVYILPRTFWSWIMIPYCLLAIGFVGFLGTFHCYLALGNQTTNEKLKMSWKKVKNPFSRGLFLNWFLVVCGTQPAKYNGSYGSVSKEPVYYKEWKGKKEEEEKKKKKKKGKGKKGMNEKRKEDGLVESTEGETNGVTDEEGKKGKGKKKERKEKGKEKEEKAEIEV
eukprot:TRINITY_DN4554_c0_g1_i1.p1 TRINITY_DN4554_c0_g1~~TRINITY_DN4554_c0_g1_i1.p1  ORF type:complete len:383 (-),score=75.99 TRINITY_DN4554_c0_g1_i1:17-1165(-)